MGFLYFFAYSHWMFTVCFFTGEVALPNICVGLCDGACVIGSFQGS